jgi:hypothetical protein
MRMTKISSSPIFIKWVFPLGILVFLSFFLVQGSRQEAAQGRSGVLFILGPMFMSAIFFTLWRQFASDLVSEIWLDEDSLVVRHKGREVRVKLASVVNVNDLTQSNWSRVILLLREPCDLGQEIAFSPLGGKGFTFGGHNKVVRNLIWRIDAARLQETKKLD